MTEPKTLPELCDWFARRDKWVWIPETSETSPCGDVERVGNIWKRGFQYSQDPFPATLDAAAGAMLPNLRLERTFCDHDHVWEWRLWEDIGAGEWCPFWRGGVGVGAIMMRDTCDEIHDRYLLAYRACVAMDGEREATNGTR
jgi:hypothetical protein